MLRLLQTDGAIAQGPAAKLAKVKGEPEPESHRPAPLRGARCQACAPDPDPARGLVCRPVPLRGTRCQACEPKPVPELRATEGAIDDFLPLLLQTEGAIEKLPVELLARLGAILLTDLAPARESFQVRCSLSLSFKRLCAGISL